MTAVTAFGCKNSIFLHFLVLIRIVRNENFNSKSHNSYSKPGI